MNVEYLDGSLPYLDGAEDELVGVFRRSEDRSSGSPELEAHIRDWPTRYHLSGRRANLARPIRIGPDDRVLDVGAGTGAITRHLLETGAEVVALEGSPARATAAAARCDGMERGRIVCGPIQQFDDPDGFDVVFVVGVLEYSADFFGGAAGPNEFLSAVRRHLRPGGTLVLAIENQIGLSYLLGAPEDHHGQPWIGVEGYRRGRPIRTWSRHRLARLLRDEGYTQQRWLAAFPDYKLPTAIIRSDAIEGDGAADLLRSVVGQITPIQADHVTPTADPALAMGTFADAGLALEIANSFVVVATLADGPDPADRLQDGSAWFEPTGHLDGPFEWQRVDRDGDGSLRASGPSGTRGLRPPAEPAPAPPAEPATDSPGPAASEQPPAVAPTTAPAPELDAHPVRSAPAAQLPDLGVRDATRRLGRAFRIAARQRLMSVRRAATKTR